MLATHRSLNCSLINIATPIEALFLVCKTLYPPVILGVCYRPPDAEPSFIVSLHELLCSITSTHRNASIILYGDFNFPSINWLDMLSSLSKNNEECEFLNMCLTFGLTQLILEPTRLTDKSAHILDLLLTSHPDNVSSLTILPGLSDHVIVHGSIHCKLLLPKKEKKLLTLYDKGDYGSMNRDLTEFCTWFLVDFLDRSVETNWLLFKNKMRDLINRYIPTIYVTERVSSPWFNNNLKRLNNKKETFSSRQKY